MGVGVDEAGQDQALAVVDDLCVGMGGAQVVGRAGCRDAPVAHQHAAARVMAGRAGASTKGSPSNRST